MEFETPLQAVEELKRLNLGLSAFLFFNNDDSKITNFKNKLI